MNILIPILATSFPLIVFLFRKKSTRECESGDKKNTSDICTTTSVENKEMDPEKMRLVSFYKMFCYTRSENNSRKGQERKKINEEELDKLVNQFFNID